MKFKISLSTYSPAVVEALSSLGYKKSQYIVQALTHFLSTKKGKTVLRLMAQKTAVVNPAAGKRDVHRGEEKIISRNSADKISIDSFL